MGEPMFKASLIFINYVMEVNKLVMTTERWVLVDGGGREGEGGREKETVWELCEVNSK